MIQHKAMSKKFDAMVMHKQYWSSDSHKPVDLLRRVAISITVLVASEFVNSWHSFTVNIQEKKEKISTTTRKKRKLVQYFYWPIPSLLFSFAVY